MSAIIAEDQLNELSARRAEEYQRQQFALDIAKDHIILAELLRNHWSFYLMPRAAKDILRIRR